MRLKRIINFLNRIKYHILTIYFLILFNPQVAYASDKIPDLKKNFKAFATEYKVYLNISIAFGILTGVLAFIVNLIRLAKNADNPKERKKTLTELAVVGITTAMLGSFGLISALYFGILMQ